MPAAALFSWLLPAAFDSCVFHVNGPGNMFGWSSCSHRCWKGATDVDLCWKDRAPKSWTPPMALCGGQCPSLGGLAELGVTEAVSVCMFGPIFPRMGLLATGWTLMVFIDSSASFISLDNYYFCVPKVSEMFFASVKCFTSQDETKISGRVPTLNYWTVTSFVLRSFCFLPPMTCSGWDKNTKPVKRNLQWHQDGYSCVYCPLVRGTAD